MALTSTPIAYAAGLPASPVYTSSGSNAITSMIICNLFAQDMEKGLIPNDEKWIADILKNICYYNAKEYFKIN